MKKLLYLFLCTITICSITGCAAAEEQNETEISAAQESSAGILGEQDAETETGKEREAEEAIIQHKSDEDSIIKSNLSNKYSTEGASLLGIYSNNNEMEYLSVDIMGEMGRKIYTYTFTEGSTVITCSEDMYMEPFYINPSNVKIKETRHNTYIILDEKVYNYSDSEEIKPVSDKMQDDIIMQMNDFINTMEKDE